MKTYIDYLVARLKEPSTWAAVSLLAGYVGYNLDETKLMAAAAAAITLIGVFWKRDSQSGTGDGTR
jgi:hypothetical protein